MEFIRKKNQQHSFRVLRSFYWGGYLTRTNQVILMGEPEATTAVIVGRVEPEGLPEEIECIALTDLVLPGSEKGFKAKKFEKVLLLKKQFIELALKRHCIPASPDLWRPYSMVLRPSGDDKGRGKLEEERLDRARFAEHLAAKIGILQKPK